MYNKESFIRQIESYISRVSGRHYKVDWQALDVESLSEITRLFRDVEQEIIMTKSRVKREPWRYM